MYQNALAEHVSAPGELFSELILGYAHSPENDLLWGGRGLTQNWETN